MDAYKLISFDKISSTQDIAKDLIAKNKVSDKTIITAKAQSNGHGRYNRKWISHHGNLYASFIYKQLEPQPTLSYAIAIAVAETLLKYNMNPKIKWPNDILIDGKKISGILIEYFNNFVIIGIGINIQTNPTIKEYKTIKTNVFSDVTTDELLSVLIKQINKWKHTEFEKVRTRWLELAFGLNTTIKYKNKTAKLIGLNNNGALILRCDDKYFLTYGDEIKFC